MTPASIRRRQEQKRSSVRQRTYQQSATAIQGAAVQASDYRISLPKVLSLTVAVGLVGLLLYFNADNRFYVRSARVTGHHLLSAEEVLSRTGYKNWNVFWINTQKAEARVLAAFPWLRSVRVQTGVPGHLLIHVYERQPAAVWEAPNGHFWVDEEGIVLVPARELGSLPLIKDGERLVVEPGDELGVEVAAAIHTAQALQSVIEATGPFGYTREKGIIVNSAQGLQVFFGIGGDLQVKVALYEALARKISENNVAADYVDVRFERAPAYGRNR